MAERLRARDILSSGPGLDEDWTPETTAPPPPPVRRAPARAVLAGAALALLAAGAWWGQRAPEPPVAAPPPTTPVTQSPPEAPPPDLVLSVRYSDAAHAYALVGRCFGSAKCWYELRASTDGGRTWRDRHIPLQPVAPPDGYSAEMTVISAGSVVVTDRGQRLFSADTGRTWRATALDSGRTVPAVPPESLLVGCRFECARPLAALDPRTGQESALANQPPFKAALNQPVTARDGSIWVAGSSGMDVVVAVSRDRGRSWRTAPLAMPSTPLFGVDVVTHDGRTAYAFVGAQAPPGVQVKNGLAAVWRTTDSGAHWQRVPSRHPASMLGAALLPDGRLLVTTEMQGSHYSSDGGRTFVRGPGDELGGIEEVDGRYVAGGMFGGFLLSEDGVKWLPLSP